MPKVSVTIKTGRTTRTYEGDYTYISVMNENGIGNRWEQEPVSWKGGLGLFHTGMEALKIVAEQKGKEGFKEAARAAMDLLGVIDPSEDVVCKEEKRKKVVAIMDKILGPGNAEKTVTKKTTKNKKTDSK